VARLTLEGLSKVFDGGQIAVDDLSLEVADGELVVLVGPSGCGKSTVLRLLAGLESPSAGRVLLDGRDVTGLPSRERDLAMVFQSYALYPHKTVRENLAFPLRMRRMAADRIRERVEQVAHTLELSECLERRPHALSGGQRQRVALGRAIVREPAAFLLDEPLSNLDAKLRRETRAELIRIRRRLFATMLVVTHDQEEAMTLGDRVVVMRAGRLEQSGTPRQVYTLPANLFVAGFVGSPAMNTIECRCVASGSGARLEAPGLVLDLPGRLEKVDSGRQVVLGIRPEDLEIGSDGDVAGRVEMLEDLGHALVVHVAVEGRAPLRVLAVGTCEAREGDPVALRVRRERLHVFDAESGVRL
jgi:multiple sugar transport system ATP-binding protein